MIIIAFVSVTKVRIVLVLVDVTIVIRLIVFLMLSNRAKNDSTFAIVFDLYYCRGQ